MLIAMNNDNERITAQPKLKGLCPDCGEPVIAKCGDIKIWHWSHRNDSQCEPQHEPETEWHLKWKRWLGLQYAEQVIEKDRTRHRADIQLQHGTVIEFQHSPISQSDIANRERFYGNMIWVFDLRDKMKSTTILDTLESSRYQRLIHKTYDDVLSRLQTQQTTGGRLIFDYPQYTYASTSRPMIFDLSRDLIFCCEMKVCEKAWDGIFVLRRHAKQIMQKFDIYYDAFRHRQFGSGDVDFRQARFFMEQFFGLRESMLTL